MEKLIKNEKHDLKNKNVNLFEITKKFFSNFNHDEIEFLIDKYLSKQLIDIFSDKDYMNSINTFFDCNFNLAEASRISFLHRNTILYRIEKIYKETGLNIRDFKDAFTFKLLSMIYEAKR